MKVWVRIKEEIAKKGSGFSDIDGDQEIRPPRDKKGKPDFKKVFELEGTRFVEQKIANGELVLVKREEEKPEKTEIVFQINGETVSSIKADADVTDEDIEELAKSDPKIKKALGDKAIKDIVVTGESVDIRIDDAE